MAYDPNDPEDKKIVQGLIDEALEEQRSAHEAEVERLNNKKDELLGKIRKLRESGGSENTGEIERLERELDEARHEASEAQSNLRIAERDLKREKETREAAEKERDTAVTERNNELLSNTLTAALVENKVAPHFMEAATALLKDKHKPTVEMEGDTRKVLIDGKDASEFIKEWSASDAGKHYVQAPANGGGGSTGANGGGNIQTGLPKLEDMSEKERLELSRTNPDAWKQVTEAAGQTAKSPVIM